MSFNYEGQSVAAHDATPGFYDPATRSLRRRDFQAERAAAGLLAEFGTKYSPATYWEAAPGWEISEKKLPHLVRRLLESGWHIEAEGRIFRRPNASSVAVSSGVDWFELHGDVDYGEQKARLPELLAALRRGDHMVRLGDGSYGMLPEQWLRRLAPVAGMGTAESDHVRFHQSQAGLLDALLAAQPEASCDQTFAAIRQELCSFHGIEAATQPAGFVGRLARLPA